MSVDPEAVGEPPEETDDYLKDANADDPRSELRAPAHEPAGAESPDDEARRAGTPD
jgi:hypothetical protein